MNRTARPYRAVHEGKSSDSVRSPAISQVFVSSGRLASNARRYASYGSPARDIDFVTTQSHNDRMNTAPTREEIDAKLVTIETRMDARVQRIEDQATRIEADMQDIKSEMKNMKWWMIGTGVSVVLAIAAFNATVLGNMIASFESGKNTAQAIEKAQNDLQKREERLDAINKKLDKLISAPAGRQQSK